MRGQTDPSVGGESGPEPRYRRAPVYAANSGGKGRPVGTLNGFGVREGVAWRWGDSCWDCSAPTAHGYCTRCRWVCETSARPEPEA